MELKESKAIHNFDVIIFDLDNTLYDETQFLFSAYRAISKYISRQTGKDAIDYEIFLVNTFISNGRQNLFNKLIDQFDLSSIISIDELLFSMHNFKTPLSLFPITVTFIEKLIHDKKSIYVLTNGTSAQQKNKILGLKLREQYPQIEVVFANDFEPKPSPFCINRIVENLKIEKTRVVLVGDSEVDELTAMNSDICFINIKELLTNGIK